MKKSLWNLFLTVFILLSLVLSGCDNSNPQIIRTSPSDSATNVPTDTPITVTFGQAVEPESFEISISPTIELVVNFAPDNAILIATPETALDENTDY